MDWLFFAILVCIRDFDMFTNLVVNCNLIMLVATCSEQSGNQNCNIPNNTYITAIFRGNRTSGLTVNISENTWKRPIKTSTSLQNRTIPSTFLLSISYYFSKRGSQVCCQFCYQIYKFI
jgi:hypothetical protein